MVALSVPRNDYPSTWSGPEGSSHSGNIVCRGVAGGAASISQVLNSKGLPLLKTLSMAAPWYTCVVRRKGDPSRPLFSDVGRHTADSL